MKKKLLSVFLVTAMLLATLPSVAFAEAAEEQAVPNEVTEETAELNEVVPFAVDTVTVDAMTFSGDKATVSVSWTAAGAPEGAKYAVFVEGVKQGNDTTELSAEVTVNYGQVSTIAVAGYTGEGEVDVAGATATGVFATKLTAAAGENKRIVNLSWAGNSGDTYTVYMNGEEIGTAEGTSYTVENLEVGKKYTFQVAEGGAKSATASYTCRPGNVTGLKSYSGYKRVVLKWNKVADATGYKIYRSTKKSFTANSSTLVKTISSNATLTYTNEVTVDKHYYYKVYAVNNGYLSGTAAKIDDEAVRPIHYKFTFKTNRLLTSHTGGKVKHTFKAGTTWTATGFNRGKYIFYYKGRQYQVLAISTKNHKVAQQTNKFNYTAKEAEYYVNQRGVSSKTPYLVFESLYTQHEYVFKGSKGKWKVVYQDEISSGKPSTPSSSGVTKVSRKVPMRHGLPYWSYLNVFSLHGKHNSWPLGVPKSGGCIRHANDYAKKIYYDCKIGTAVCVY